MNLKNNNVFYFVAAWAETSVLLMPQRGGKGAQRGQRGRTPVIPLGVAPRAEVEGMALYYEGDGAGHRGQTL